MSILNYNKLSSQRTRINLWRACKIGIVGLCVTAQSIGVQAAPACMSQTEAQAAQSIFVQNQLMVAALQCDGQAYPAIDKAYVDFVGDREGGLVRAQQTIKHYLKRTQSKSIDKYVTRLANQLSLRSSLDFTFCQKVEKVVSSDFLAKSTASIAATLPIQPKMADGCVKSVDQFAENN